MYLVIINKNNLPQDMVLVTTDLDKAQAQFLDTCSTQISNWDEYDQDDKDALLDLGYEQTGDGAVVLIDTEGFDDELEPEEVWYVWKERTIIEGEKKPRLLTPWGDPKLYEFPFDFLYASPEEAIADRKEHEAEDEDWVLCRETLTPQEI